MKTKERCVLLNLILSDFSCLFCGFWCIIGKLLINLITNVHTSQRYCKVGIELLSLFCKVIRAVPALNASWNTVHFRRVCCHNQLSWGYHLRNRIFKSYGRLVLKSFSEKCLESNFDSSVLSSEYRADDSVGRLHLIFWRMRRHRSYFFETIRMKSHSSIANVCEWV